MADSPAAAGDIASEFIDQELDVERARKSSLEARGVAVITTSGTLVTLLFGLAALVTESSEFALTGAARWLLTAATALFVAAAALGILCNAPSRYRQVDPASLEVFVEPGVWVENGSDAKRELTAARLEELADARARNQRKGQLAAGALGIQVVAVLVTAIAVAVILK